MYLQDESKRMQIGLRYIGIYLRRFWFILPAFAVTVCLVWLLWGLSPWISLFLPLVAGVATFFAFATMASAWG